MTVSPRFCTECGKPAQSDAKFCPHCGAPLPAAPSSEKVRPGLPDLGALRGPCVLLRTGSSVFNIGEVGRVVAKAVGRPLGDVTRRMSATRGVLAEGMEGEKAQKVVPELRTLGVECIAIPVDETAKFSEAAYLRDGKFTETGMKCELVTWDGWQFMERPWADVLLVSCTQLVTENAQVVDLGGGLLRRREKIVTSVNRRGLLDFFFSEPLLHVRVEETVPQQEGERVVPTHPLAYLQNLARQVLRITPPIGVNEGVRLLATEAPPEAFGPVAFSSRRDVDQYNRWLVELLRRGLSIPR